MLAKLKGWRTFIFNGASALAMIGPPIMDLLISSSLFSARTTLILGIINIVGNVYLRTLTDSPAGKAE